MEKTTLLYITFIDSNCVGNSGSSVRPLRMLQAFENLDINVKVLYGTNARHKVRERKHNVSEVIEWIKHNHVDICYVEPPSGPMFCTEDHRLLKTLHSQRVPIALFYRDCYWMFPATYDESGIGTFKRTIIKVLSKRDLKVFNSVCSKLYYPSKTMAELIPLHIDWDVLPPGAEEFDLEQEYVESIRRLEEGRRVSFFYIGGATKRYGIDLLIESLIRVNKDKHMADLTIVCPKEQWGAFEERTRYESLEWLRIYHLRPGKELEELYRIADVCVLPMKKEMYSDFAVNVKLFEYIAHKKPILTTNCFEVSKIVDNYGIGWIVNDDVSSMSKQMSRIAATPKMIIPYKENCHQALIENTWDARARKVVNDLLSIREIMSR